MKALLVSQDISGLPIVRGFGERVERREERLSLCLNVQSMKG